MKSFIRVKIIQLLIGLAIILLIASGLTRSSGTIDTEVIITIAGEEYHYLPQPELGYVVKIQQDDNKVNTALQTTIEALLLPENALPIGSLDRRGVWIIENKQPAEQVQNTRILFSNQSNYQYMTPLFSCNGDTVAVIPEIVVRVNPEIQAEQVQAMCEKIGYSIIKPMKFTTQEYLVEVPGPDAYSVFAAVEQLNEVEWIEWAAPNKAMQLKLLGQSFTNDSTYGFQLQNNAGMEDVNGIGVFPNDEYFSNQWHLYNTGQSGGIPGADIHAPEAWKITTGDPNIVVAVFDSGADREHPDLVDNLVPGYDFLGDDNQPDPSLVHGNNPHGTACAGLIAARGDNWIGVSGVTWNCKIMPIRIYRALASGTEFWCVQADIATAFRFAASNGADVLSNSWTGGTSSPTIIQSAIVDVTKAGGIGRGGKGCVVFFAAGNNNGEVHYPGKYPEVISVGATDHNDVRCYYSSYGPKLDIVAPSGPGYTEAEWLSTKGKGWPWTTDISGTAGWNMDPFDPNILDYTAGGGTSMSCPITAGVAALILSIEPNLTNEEVRHFLIRSTKDLGDSGRDDYYGWGRVDARAALDMVLAKRCDLNNDWKVDEDDLLILMQFLDTNEPSADIAPAAKRDGFVDLNDVTLMEYYLHTEIPEPNLIAHWKLDEEEGLIAYDSSGYYHDANVIDYPNWQPEGGTIEGALEFDGIADYVRTPFILNPASGPFSVFAWIRGGAPGQVILSQIGNKNLLSADTSTGNLIVELKSARGQPLVSQTVITDNNWHHIGFVWDGSYRTLYVDDVIVAIDTSSQSTLSGSTNGLFIGCGKDKATGSFWTGLIDDVRIYNRAITP